jgi:hypothetical protein
MTDFDYKKYSLENLENWLHDAISSAEASPQEIYDTIHKVVSENYYHHKHHASRAYELMEKLNGLAPITFKSCNNDDPSPECQNAWTDFWESSHQEYLNTQKDKVNKWVLPVELDGLTGECYIRLPDDLLELANLKEGDQVEWIDRKDGSFEMRKVDGTK